MAPEKSTAVKKPEYHRAPAVAGAFYEGNREKLEKIVRGYLDEAPEIEIPGTLIGFMEPHAGHVYSGSIAANGYRQVLDREYETVIVMAPSHRARFPGVSVIPRGTYNTPLGSVVIDDESVEKMVAGNLDVFGFYPQAHESEHSLEVQVPFLQVALKKGWKIVPILFGDNDVSVCSSVAQGIARIYDPDKHLIIASSDMSHFHTYERARQLDLPALDSVEKLDLQALFDGVNDRRFELCGTGPVITLMIFSSALKGQGKILKYANSGDTAGDKSRVVGYGCVAFSTTAKIEKVDYPADKSENGVIEDESADRVDFTVSEDEKKMLLEMARKTLEKRVKENKMPDLSEYESPLLDEELGLFVTLRKEPSKMLRGCIGHCFPVKKLREALPELTESAAFSDPRFPPVSPGEVDDVNIEISLLSPMRRISDWREIKIPGHGVFVKRGYRSGVFLPQVADETGWDRETFMAHLCRDKAGLPVDAWKDPETELYVFIAVKFAQGKD